MSEAEMRDIARHYARCRADMSTARQLATTLRSASATPIITPFHRIGRRRRLRAAAIVRVCGQRIIAYLLNHATLCGDGRMPSAWRCAGRLRAFASLCVDEPFRRPLGRALSPAQMVTTVLAMFAPLLNRR
jgi:hypothetical protein